MEELQSTEVLDREILEDARKKAQRILKTADETGRTQAEAWEKKTADAIADAKKRYQERLEGDREEIMARLPLDKRRIRLEKIEALLHSAIRDYLAALSPDRMLALLGSELEKRLQLCPEIGSSQSQKAPTEGVPLLEVMFRGIGEGELETLLNKLLPATGNNAVPWVIRRDYSFYGLPGDFPAIIINADKVRITASVDNAVDSLLKDKRAELVSSLLDPAALSGDGIPQGLSEEASHA